MAKLGGGTNEIHKLLVYIGLGIVAYTLGYYRGKKQENYF